MKRSADNREKNSSKHQRNHHRRRSIEDRSIQNQNQDDGDFDDDVNGDMGHSSGNSADEEQGQGKNEGCRSSLGNNLKFATYPGERGNNDNDNGNHNDEEHDEDDYDDDIDGDDNDNDSPNDEGNDCDDNDSFDEGKLGNNKIKNEGLEGRGKRATNSSKPHHSKRRSSSTSKRMKRARMAVGGSSAGGGWVLRTSNNDNTSSSRRRRHHNHHHHHRHHNHHQSRRESFDRANGESGLPNAQENADLPGRPVAAAASAAAASGSNNASVSNNEDVTNDPLLVELLEQFRAYLTAEGVTDPSTARIDLQKAKNVLEATAGNVSMAAQLYWDDHFATFANHHHHQQQRNEPQEEPNAEPLRRRSNSDEDGLDEADRRVRRRLDNEFGRAFAQNRPEGEQDPNEMAGDIPVRQLVADAMAAHVRRRLAVDDMAESVSVSDDEIGSGGVWRIRGSIAGRMAENEPQARAASRAASRRNVSNSPEAARRRMEAANRQRFTGTSNNHPDDSDDDEALSDDDWLWGDGEVLRQPLGLLWGPKTQSNNSHGADMNRVAREGNVIADEDNSETQAVAGIPSTWMHCGFHLSSCSNGLVVRAPTVEDLDYMAWRQQQNEGGRNSRNFQPPPYHCKAITAVLSLVTAMIYTGASIQGRYVNCTSSNKPFIELTEDEKKREFDTRLADALAALLFIAASTSMRRKQKAYDRAKLANIDPLKLKNMKRRINLVPTCRWKDDSGSGDGRAPDGRDSNQPIRVAISLTNILDLHAYVRSSLRSFTSRGGCALFLETLLRIHGRGVVHRMLRANQLVTAKEKSLTTAKKNENESVRSLILCTCEERYHQTPRNNQSSTNNNNNNNDQNAMLDTTPPGHTCVSTELLSLLITGRIHSGLKGWSTQGLNFGVLSGAPGEVGWQLARPEKPVWILRGETCYSVLWCNPGEETPDSIGKKDCPGHALNMTHWNCWYGQRQLTKFRLVTAPGKWSPPKFSNMETLLEEVSDNMKYSTVEAIAERRRKSEFASIVSADEHEEIEKEMGEFAEIKEQLDRIKVHPEDPQFYPEKYIRWRFDIVGDTNENWVPYYRLSRYEKKLVEMKFGPKLKSILWTRWPYAMIDNFEPAEGPKPVV